MTKMIMARKKQEATTSWMFRACSIVFVVVVVVFCHSMILLHSNSVATTDQALECCLTYMIIES